jgi:hypothetical protein
MAYNLTPQEFAALQQQFLQQRAQAPTGEANSYYDSTNPYFANGTLYAPSYGDNAVSQGRAMDAAPSGYTTYDYNDAANNKQSLYNGQPYTSIDSAGNVTGNGKLSGFTDSTFMSEWGPFLMAAAGMAPALMGAGAAGAGSAAAGNSFDNGVLNSTIMNGVGGAEAAGGAGGAALGNSFDGGALNSAVVNGVGGETLPTLGTLSAGDMTMPALPGEMSTFGGAGPISSLFPASVAKYLGPAAALLGAVAGSQPVKQSTTQTRDIPDWLKPSVGGLLGYTNQKLAQDMAPGALAGYDQMKQVGQGLMSAPIAGNGFAQFTKGRY